MPNYNTTRVPRFARLSPDPTTLFPLPYSHPPSPPNLFNSSSSTTNSRFRRLFASPILSCPFSANYSILSSAFTSILNRGR